MPVRWCEDAGLRYLCAEYSAEMGEADAIRVAQDVAAEVVAATEQPVACLAHINGMRPTAGYLAVAKRLNREVFGPMAVRIAVCGLPPPLRALANGFGNVGGGVRVVACRTESEALAWLRKG